MTPTALPAPPVPAPATATAPVAAAEAAPPRVSGWFAVTGVLLLATLMAAVFVQARQLALLDMAVRSQDDYLALSLYQVQTEFLRLREQLHEHIETPDPPALQLRYDIFVSRVALLRTDRAARLLASSAATATVLRELGGFTHRADMYLGPEAKGPLSAGAAAALLAELHGLDAPIQRMLLDASHRVAEQATSRQEQVRQHNRIGLGLTGFLLAMVLLFAGLALRQMRQLEQRRLRLQALADQLREARIEAETASKAKSDFLADMSHELRTPLHGLLGMLSLLRDAPADRRAPDWLATADESAAHLLRLLDDMLDLSKLEAGTLALAPRGVHLAALVREVQALLQPAAQAKGLVLQCEVAADLPGHVWLDPTRLKQILYNLLGNAVKFSDRGAIVMHCRRQPGNEGEPDQLVFEVADTGIGMDADTLARLFQRFSRASDPRARLQDGTGLGLAISRNLAMLMDGEIQVRSTPGHGSVFSFRCRLQPVPAPADQGVPAPAGSARPLQVLVAEDHPVNRLYMAALLDRLGHQTTLVDNGLEAVKAAQSRRFDLVLMDVHMPLMDGVAAIRAIRPLNGSVGADCIVALTADVFGDTHDRCLATGAVEVATKPLSLPMLQTLLDRHFGASRPTGPAPTPAADGPAAGLVDPRAVAELRSLMPDAAELRALYDTFFGQTALAAQAMRRAMRDAQAEALKREAHAVKGAALNLGLPALAEAAARLNREAGSLSAAELALAVQRFEEVAAATRAFCQAEGLAGDG